MKSSISRSWKVSKISGAIQGLYDLSNKAQQLNWALLFWGG
jgi:hypothetical protein